MVTRREYLQRSSAIALAANGSSWGIESTPAPFPTYPSIPESVLNRHGWVQTERRPHEQLASANWSISTYQWSWLRNLVARKTTGMVDIPLGGLIAFHISDDGTTRRFGDTVLTQGDDFLSPTIAKWELDDNIGEFYERYLQSFTESPLEIEGSLDWDFGPSFPSSVGFVANECMPGGELTTEMVGTVQTTQFNLTYELTDTTANANQRVALAETEELEFSGWLAGWSHQDHVWAVGSVHPKATGDYCGIDNPHLEEVLSEVTGEDIELNLDKSLYGRVRSLMSTIGEEPQ